MRILLSSFAITLLLELSISAQAYVLNSSPKTSSHFARRKIGAKSVSSFDNIQGSTTTTSLGVSIGLGPEKDKAKDTATDEEDEDRPLVAGIDYEIPDHEKYRKSRRSAMDEMCDEWFKDLMQDSNGILDTLAQDSRERLCTTVPLVNEVQAPFENKEEWTPYVNSRLPWSPLMPAYGLEEFGLPIPRRSAETWRQFDVAGLIQQDYSTPVEGKGTDLKLSDEKVLEYQQKLSEEGGWLDDEVCFARLVYINGQYVPQLSKSNEIVRNLSDLESISEETKGYLSRLTDGFTDELVSPVPSGYEGATLTSLKKLSGPDHKIGEATSQFAINTQQGTACFAALNTMCTGAVAYIHTAEAQDNGIEMPKPVLIVNAVTASGGIPNEEGESSGDDIDNERKGMVFHPRTVVVGEDASRLSLVQSCVDLDDGSDHRPKLYNGYTQVFLKGNANITHSYIEESGGFVTGGVEESSDARKIESQRPSRLDTHLESIDVHIAGKNGAYEGTMIGVGGSGRIRVAQSVTLLQPGASATVNGFQLSGGFQRCDMKTNIHHIAAGTISRQAQKNMVGGRATGAFRGRIRVEQSAQQTDSEQLSRTILLTDKSRAWSVPSLEIIADDVVCAHGATVSDLSEEELFYLRSRGLNRANSRNLLMFAFSGDISACVAPEMQGDTDGKKGLQKRIIQRLEKLAPRGKRAIQGEFQSV